jgi:hypothetical protein
MQFIEDAKDVKFSFLEKPPASYDLCLCLC